MGIDFKKTSQEGDEREYDGIENGKKVCTVRKKGKDIIDVEGDERCVEAVSDRDDL